MSKKNFKREDPAEVMWTITKLIGKGLLWGSASIVALGVGLNIYEVIDSQDNEPV